MSSWSTRRDCSSVIKWTLPLLFIAPNSECAAARRRRDKFLHRREGACRAAGRAASGRAARLGDIWSARSVNSTFLTFSSSQISRRALRATPDACCRRRITSTFASGCRTLSLSPCGPTGPARRSRGPGSSAPKAVRRSRRRRPRDSRTDGRSRSSALRLAERRHGQVLPQRLGQERHERRDQLRRREQALVERPIGVELVRRSLSSLPEAIAAAADVPVARGRRRTR